ncbi:hypothetical protein Tco_0462559 [Tanacetum coccineum]
MTTMTLVNQGEKPQYRYICWLCTLTRRRTEIYYNKNAQDSGNVHVPSMNLSTRLTALQSGRSRSELVKDPEPPSVPPTKKQVEDLFQWFDDDEVIPPPAVPIPPVNVHAAPAPENANDTSDSDIETLFDHVDSNVFDTYTAPETDSEASSSNTVNIDVTPNNQLPHVQKWTQAHSLENIIGDNGPDPYLQASLRALVWNRGYAGRKFNEFIRLDNKARFSGDKDIVRTVVLILKESFAPVARLERSGLFIAHASIREVPLVQLNFLDIGLLAGHPKSRKVRPSPLQKLNTSPYQDVVLKSSGCVLNTRGLGFAVQQIRMYIMTFKVAIALCFNSVQHSRSKAHDFVTTLSKKQLNGKRFATLLPLLGVKQMSPETLKELLDESVSESVGRTVADSSTARLKRATTYVFRWFDLSLLSRDLDSDLKDNAEGLICYATRALSWKNMSRTVSLLNLSVHGAVFVTGYGNSDHHFLFSKYKELTTPEQTAYLVKEIFKSVHS